MVYAAAAFSKTYVSVPVFVLLASVTVIVNVWSPWAAVGKVAGEVIVRSVPVATIVGRSV